MNFNSALVDMMACPACKARLAYNPEKQKLTCQNSQCGLSYRIEDGIPIMLVDEAEKPESNL